MKSIKSIVLDTTYVLPLFGIEINLSPSFIEDMKLLWNGGINGYEFYLPSICLIEAMFKLLGEYRKNKEFSVLERYQISLPTVLNSPIIILSPELNPNISLIAIKIRHMGHLDFMDCWIAASAVILKSILLTEDKVLVEVLQNISETQNLTTLSWNDFKKVLKNKS